MTTRFVFVGERPSATATAMGVSWKDGRLAAAQLFRALWACGLDPSGQSYTNLFDDQGDVRHSVLYALVGHPKAGRVVVAMGRKVQRELEARGLAHVKLVHPAARGKVRKKENYAAHVRQALGPYLTKDGVGA
jgi:hypothetical protein